jgi:hypothetical protein
MWPGTLRARVEAEQERKLTIGAGVMRKIVVYDEHVASLLHEEFGRYFVQFHPRAK